MLALTSALDTPSVLTRDSISSLVDFIAGGLGRKTNLAQATAQSPRKHPPLHNGPGIPQQDSPAGHKALPALLAEDLPALIARLEHKSVPAVPDEPLPGYRRICVADPLVNRIELLEPV